MFFGNRYRQQQTAFFQGEVPCAPVHDIAGALENPFVSGSDRVADFASPDGPVRMLAGPVRVPGTEQPRRAGPGLGADTEAMLEELGYDAGRIADLRAAGIIG